MARHTRPGSHPSRGLRRRGCPHAPPRRTPATASADRDATPALRSRYDAHPSEKPVPVTTIATSPMVRHQNSRYYPWGCYRTNDANSRSHYGYAPSTSVSKAPHRKYPNRLTASSISDRIPCVLQILSLLLIPIPRAGWRYRPTHCEVRSRRHRSRMGTARNRQGGFPSPPILPIGSSIETARHLPGPDATRTPRWRCSSGVPPVASSFSRHLRAPRVPIRCGVVTITLTPARNDGREPADEFDLHCRMQARFRLLDDQQASGCGQMAQIQDYRRKLRHHGRCVRQAQGLVTILAGGT